MTKNNRNLTLINPAVSLLFAGWKQPATLFCVKWDYCFTDSDVSCVVHFYSPVRFAFLHQAAIIRSALLLPESMLGKYPKNDLKVGSEQ